MPVASNILRLSGTLYWVVTVAAVLLPALVLAALLRDVLNPAALGERFAGLSPPPGAGRALAAGLAGLLPMAALVYALWQMRALFARYRRGEILSDAGAASLLRIGRGLFALAALGIVAHSLQGLILTAGNPPGQRSLSIAVDAEDLGLLLAGAFVVVLGRVMREAARVAAENESFV